MNKILQTWLSRQCRMLSGSIQAVLLTAPTSQNSSNRTFFWPDEQRDHSVLSRIAKVALHKKRAVIQTRSNAVEETGEPLDALACPLYLNARLFGVVAIGITSCSPPMQQAAVKQIQAGAKWLETMIQLQGSAAREKLGSLVDLLTTGMENERFRIAATEVVNKLAERFSCDRVSLGFLRYGRVRIEAMSHSSRIDQDSNLVRAIQEAMNEALDQRTTLIVPVESDETDLVTRFHVQLAKRQQGAAICTVPLVKNGKAVGALLMKRGEDKPFTKETVAQCEQIGLLLGPALEMRRRDERSIFAKIFDSIQDGLKKFFGPHHLTLKAGAIPTLVLLIWLCVASAPFRISCDSVLEAEICRAVVAPQQGYIAETHVRAGDLVREGDILAKLDDRELLLEQRKWQTQSSQLLREYRKALAGFDRAEVAILNAKRAQAEAQLRLVEQQLKRTNLVAPFSGVVVKGDLSQMLGSPIERGEALFEVAPNDEYRVVLKVDDRDIGLVQLGQRGQLKLSGIPDRTIGISMDRVTPVSLSERGHNYFRVEAVMDQYSDLMRPGMKGIAKIEIGREKLFRIWTRRLVDWVRLFVWNHLP